MLAFAVFESNGANRVNEHGEFLKELFAAKPEFDDGVRWLISYCRSIVPAARWALIESLDFFADSEGFAAWVSRNAPNPVASALIRALHFALSEEGDAIQMDGAHSFDLADTECGWASEVVYRSTEDWADSAALHAFQTISEQSDGSVPILLYVLCLGYVGLLIQHRAPAALWDGGHVRRVPIAVGFLDGDSYVVLSPEG